MPEDYDGRVPFEVYLFVDLYVREASDKPYMNPIDVWMSVYERELGTEDITVSDLIYGLVEYSDAEVTFNSEHSCVEVWGVQQ